MLAALGPGLRTLELTTNGLTGAVAEDLKASIIKNASSLEYIGLESNELGSDGAKSVRAPASCLLFVSLLS